MIYGNNGIYVIQVKIKKMICKVLLALFFITMNAQENNVVSKLETIDIKSRSRTIIYEGREHFEAPNWSLDGKYLIFNTDSYTHLTLPTIYSV